MDNNINKFVINTYKESEISADLSSSGQFNPHQLHIIDDNDSGRTVIPSYDLLKSDVKGLSTDIYSKIDDAEPLSGDNKIATTSTVNREINELKLELAVIDGGDADQI